MEYDAAFQGHGFPVDLGVSVVLLDFNDVSADQAQAFPHIGQSRLINRVPSCCWKRDAEYGSETASALDCRR